MTDPLLPASDLAALDTAALAKALRPLWEQAPWLAGRLTGWRFGTWGEVVDAAEAEIDAAGEEERASLLAAHPRLGTDKAVLRATSAESWAEQGGDSAPTREVLERLAELNEAYEERFGFPFVEWVRGRPLEEIIPVIEARLAHDRTDEIAAGCAALVSIARDRLAQSPAPAKSPEPQSTP